MSWNASLPRQIIVQEAERTFRRGVNLCAEAVARQNSGTVSAARADRTQINFLRGALYEITGDEKEWSASNALLSDYVVHLDQLCLSAQTMIDDMRDAQTAVTARTDLAEQGL